MRDRDALLSVVVPVYNVEKYLTTCLDSLLNQSIMDHKIILVNDGSKDASGEIAERYAAEHGDIITYIKQDNKGLGAARNTGLAVVDTPYVTFLDSDDWWDTKLIEKVKCELSLHEEEPDLIFTLPTIYDSVSRLCIDWYDRVLIETCFYPYKSAEKVVSKELNAKKDLWLYALEPNACRRIYRTKFLKEHAFAFPEGVKWEDVQPHFQLLHRAKRCIAVRTTGFIYRINTLGQTTAEMGKTRLDMIPVFKDTFSMAFDEAWEKEEIAYIIRMFINFTSWSIDVTNTDYIKPLLKGMHELYRMIPSKYWKVYFNLCSPERTKERLSTWIMKSPMYMIMADYRIRSLGSKWIGKMKEFVKKLRGRRA